MIKRPTKESTMRFPARIAFTLIEVMIALVLSLLVLAAVAQAFKQIGDKINQSQSEVELSVALRDLSNRLVDDLQNIATTPVIDTDSGTAAAPFMAKSSGYLVYHEGPMTNETTAHVNLGLLGEQNAAQTDYFELSRYGDLDDYLAFTATSSSRAPFSGYIPYGILAANRYVEIATNRPGASAATISGLISNPDGSTPYDADGAATLVPFYSTEAEIAYWVSPIWDRWRGRDPTGAVDLTGTLDHVEKVDGEPLKDGSGHPTFRDFEGDANDILNADLYTAAAGDPDIPDADGLPDRCQLRRRTLLIRPELNVNLVRLRDLSGIPYAPLVDAFGSSEPNVLPFLIPGGTTHTLAPLSFLTGVGGALRPRLVRDVTTGDLLPIELPGTWWNGGTDEIGLNDDVGVSEVTSNFLHDVSPDWLAGIARLQQVMDLSVSRVVNNWDTPSATLFSPSTNFGMPSRLVEANSMAQLADPHKRFAHVRIPRRLLAPPLATQSARASTLPVLALTAPMPFLTAAELQGSVPSAGSPRRFLPALADPDGGSSTSSNPTGETTLGRYGRFTMLGFLRPEFNLADRFTAVAVDGSESEEAGLRNVATDLPRAGTDVIVSRLLGFDVQVHDPNASDITWVGPGGSEGFHDAAGYAEDDDGDGVGLVTNGTLDEDELGWPGSDDEILQANDLSIQRAMLDTAATRQYYSNATGGFVDLNSLLLSGHPAGGILSADAGVTRHSVTKLEAPILPNRNGLGFITPYSGYEVIPVGGGRDYYFSGDLQQSGAFIIRDGSSPTSTLNSFVQSNYDTHTMSYQLDRFDQESRTPLTLAPTYTGGYFDRSYTLSAKQDNSPAFDTVNFPVASRIWSPGEGFVRGRYTTVDVPLAQTGGDLGKPVKKFDPNDPLDISAPVQKPLRALRIQIRLIDETTGQIQQRTIVHSFGRF